MPLFSSNKFSPKKIPQRKTKSNFNKKKQGAQTDEKFEIEKITLNIGEQSSVFEEGEWIQENGSVGAKFKENQKLKQQIQKLEAENNILRLKTEVLLDMLTETTAEAHIQDKEISRLRQEISRIL